VSESGAAVIILTMGNRPARLARAVASVREQETDAAVVVVANGCDIDEPPGTTLIELPLNRGIPAGRNAGVAGIDADVVLFLDDDGAYHDKGVIGAVVAAFAADPRLGVISLRIDDDGGGLPERRHVPRLRASDPERSSEVTTFLGGASAVRRSLFDEVGLLPGAFFYGHEETDFAWRVLDAGYRIEYRGDLAIVHPAAAAHHHDEYYFRSARNRVWLARRRLPWPVAVVYVAVWLGLSLIRPGQWAGRKPTLLGFGAGLRESAGERKPMAWSTVARMARLGRPPII
jgi:GT2 family glycosyltransferase